MQSEFNFKCIYEIFWAFLPISKLMQIEGSRLYFRSCGDIQHPASPFLGRIKKSISIKINTMGSLIEVKNYFLFFLKMAWRDAVCPHNS
jgi:hypothetical protein